ncbi:MAG: PfkB family carbohydrate kinase [Candidatus Krumholzibacteria bacterium]|nr:PfkB family carbohydrate kinase [Candidatus Krumholzibacteria bacterium]
MSIVVVGTVAFDTVEAPWGRADRVIGGSATYFSLAASHFSPVKIVAVVGGDFCAEHRLILEDRGVDLEGLIVEADGKTFFWEGRYGEDPNERETLCTELNVFAEFRPELPPSYRSTRWLFLGNIDPDIQMNVLDQADARPFVGCDTMNFWIERKPESLSRLLRRVDVLFVNDSEARDLSGKSNLVRAAKEILEMGPRAVVIKKGEHGAFLFTRESRFFAPAYPLGEVFDPTGAGDSFAGGFMGYLASAPAADERHLRRAMIYGTITGSFACESFSVERLRGLTDAHIATRFGELVDLVHIELD